MDYLVIGLFTGVAVLNTVLMVWVLSVLIDNL